MSINHISLMGIVSRGPEFRMTQSGHPNLTFTVAVSRPARADGTPGAVDYVRVITWRALAERLKDTLHKDQLVVVEGRLTTRSYETQDGQRRKVVEVEAFQASPVETGSPQAAGRSTTSSSEPDGPIYDDDFGDHDAPAPAPAAAPKAPARQTTARPAPAAPAAAQDFDDEIPF
jgi:single-strand DNA-binding protein